MLYRAIRYGYTKIVSNELKRGIDPNKMMKYRKYPLHYAVEKTRLEVIRILVGYGADLNKQNSQYETPLEIAVNRQNEECVRLLIELGANGIMLLEMFLRRSDVPQTLFMLKLGFDPNTPVPDGYFPLFHTACLCQSIVILNAMITAGANVHILDKNGRNAWFACDSNRLYDNRIIDRLILLNINTNQRDNEGNVPLAFALKHRNHTLIYALLPLTSDLNIPNSSGTYLIHMIIRFMFNSTAYLKFIERGVNINVQDSNGYTPLHYAARCLSYPYVELLLKHGADSNIIANDGDTPLHINFRHGKDSGEMLIPLCQYINNALKAVASAPCINYRSICRETFTSLWFCGADLNLIVIPQYLFELYNKFCRTESLQLKCFRAMRKIYSLDEIRLQLPPCSFMLENITHNYLK